MALAGCPGTRSGSDPITDGGGDGGQGLEDLFTISAEDWSLPETGALPESGSSPDGTPPEAGCAGTSEKLDGKDNNCNGKVDEGFWAVPQTAAYTTLTAKHSGCTAATALSVQCASASHRFCIGQGYSGGIGPVEFGTSSALVICVADAKTLDNVPYTSLTAKHSGCTYSNPFCMSCNAAIHRYCAGLGAGYVSGAGPEELASSAGTIICVTHAAVLLPTWAELTAQHSGCTLAAAFSAPCRAAVNRHCSVKGYETGFGPVEVGTSGAAVTCLSRQ